MDPAQILSVLSALAAGVWSVLTWSGEQQRERRLKRDQEAALFVNSFMLSTEELQARLYSILEEGELAFYKKEYPGKYDVGSPAAIEILYRLGQYFGWARLIYRYGPYTRDSRVIELTRRIAKAWESRSFPGDAFRCSLDERSSLGAAVVRRVGEVTAVLPVFESIPFFQFAQEVSDELNKRAPLYRSAAVRRTLEAIDRADRVEAMEGHERLAVLQNLLVELLAYLENREGFSVSIGERRKARVKGAYGRLSATPSTVATIIHQTRGRIRLRVPRLKTDASYATGLQSLLESLEDILSIRVNISAASVIINYSPDIPDDEFAQRAIKTIEGGSSAALSS
ncbi:MAG TPA: hypothetical protein VFG09_03855 [Thermodesulfovibrionales bacterium]|nr:hypothetical protein [Thermodesulfovibrionales bacterium]